MTGKLSIEHGLGSHLDGIAPLQSTLPPDDECAFVKQQGHPAAVGE